jgi:CRISPR-associated endonuclease Cas1
MELRITVPHRVRQRISGARDSVSQIIESPIVPRHGVVTLWGYGISVSVDKGHLMLRDGVGDERRTGRFPRVNHGIRRLVIIGSDGAVSLAALRWLADQDASFLMLERDGSVLLTTGPVSASDARLRRAQACAGHSDVAVHIARELIDRKLAGQETVAREKLNDARAADVIAHFRGELRATDSIGAVRYVESQASAAYWSAWRSLRVVFPKADLKRVPDHWCVFGSRTSPVSHGARSAANPANAMLNYLYAVLESETRLTIAALGLDPGLGLLHIDSANRDSLACDLMEPIRASVDAFVLDWIAKSPLRREWFFEQRDGTCRLMPALASRLAETARMWRAEAAPLAEWFAEVVSSVSSDARVRGPRTRLTRQRWREAMRRDEKIRATEPELQSVCRTCGAAISQGNSYCKACSVDASTRALVEGAKQGRIKANDPEALAKRKESSKRQNEALQAWSPEDHPEWLTNDVYMSQVLPRLARVTRAAIRSAIGVSEGYATEVRRGTRVPHVRHWVKLAKLVGASSNKPC